jgi:hypothetical protein
MTRPKNYYFEPLGGYRRSFERGDKGALLQAIYYCARFGTPLPKWAMEAFEAAQGRGMRSLANLGVRVGAKRSGWNRAVGRFGMT